MRVATGFVVDCNWSDHSVLDSDDGKHASYGLVKNKNAVAKNNATLNNETNYNTDSGEESAVGRGDEDARVKGAMHKAASSVLMQVLYASRMARPDLLHPTSRLASYVTKWTPYRDTPLHRLVCYLWSTLDYLQEGYISQRGAQIVACADSDVAGCVDTMRSTSGGHVCLEGPPSRAPIHSPSKRQDSAASTTPVT